jgi:hypothetical protein
MPTKTSSSQQRRRQGQGRSSSSQQRSRSSSAGSGRRGFAALSASERREIAARGGRASHGGRGFDDRDESRFSRSRQSGDYDQDERGNFQGDRSRYESSSRGRSNYDNPRGGRSHYEGSQGGRSSYDDERGGSRRGFAAMDPERRREIASRGGHASHGGRGDDYDDSRSWRSDSRFGRADYDEGGYSGSSFRSGRSRGDYDDSGRDYEDSGSGSARYARDDYGPAEERRFTRSRSPEGDDEDYENDDRGRRFSDEDDDYDYAVRGRGDQEFYDDPGRRSDWGSRRDYGPSDRDDYRSHGSRGGRGSQRNY